MSKKNLKKNRVIIKPLVVVPIKEENEFFEDTTSDKLDKRHHELTYSDRGIIYDLYNNTLGEYKQPINEPHRPLKSTRLYEGISVQEQISMRQSLSNPYKELMAVNKFNLYNRIIKDE